MLATIATKDTNQLGTPDNLDNQLRATQSARMLVDAYAIGVNEQAILKLDDIPELATHQQTAKTHATNWLNTVSPLLIQTNTDLLDFANNFGTFFNPLMNMAQSIDTGNNRQQFVQGLQLLVTKITTHQTAAQSALTSLEGLQGDVASDLANFQADLTKANSLYEGDKGAIAQLQKSNDSLQGSMKKDMMMIGFGSTAMVVGGLMIAVGVLGEIETAGVSTALVVAGLAVVAGGATATGLGGSNYTKALDQYKKNMRLIAQDNAQISALQAMQHQIDNLVDAGQQAVTALQTMVTAWQTLGTQYNAVIDQLQNNVNPNDGPFLVAELQTAQADWNDLVGTATLINQQCANLPTQQTDPGVTVSGS